MDLDPDACYRAIATRDARFDGRLFIAVKTTGIYCRPICPARTPKRENLVFYPSAAAAQEAGFRPCLRCRPETAPDLGVWRGTSNTVSRALALIEKGGLDGADVEALAERLGVGERQLRRLFRRHLGASPIAVAQTRRVLLAKHLIHETRLPMSEVALAAGFGSIRRFNETFQRLFGRAPSTLRRGGAAPTGPTGEVVILLPYRPPYDWPAMLAFLRARAIPGVETVTRDGYARTIEIGGAHGTVAVRPTALNALRATIQFPQLSALPTIVARLRRVFDLVADPEVIGAHLAEDPALAPLVAARPGLRVAGAWDGFELAVRALLGQQITVTAAVGLAGKLVATYGKPLTGAIRGFDGLTHVFPGPERLAEDDLSGLGLTRARAAALGSLARAVIADPELFGPRRSLDEAIVKLRALPGVGEWTAQYIAMREMREPDAFPAADIGLMRALADRKGRRPSPAALLARAERWRPWRAYAAQHLWASQGMSYDRGKVLRDDRSPLRPLHPARPAARRLRADGDREARDAGAGRAPGRRRARPGRARRPPAAT
ncbi:MAG TPA: AlkA N-terminal domain-containing protein [Candidatus Limnocylindria bacterium]|nr:AlkA N-terminal domain-containing protein [Candidatus Limnocylindria bacterium]